MKNSIKYEISKYLEIRPLGAFGGQIEDYIRSTSGSKGDTTARRLREMVEDGKIICEKRQIEGKGPSVNFYRVGKIEEDLLTKTYFPNNPIETLKQLKLV